MIQTDRLLRELNHRIQNNFQIILSLMNLKKRSPVDNRHSDDLRFIEEHVQAMAIAYRLVYATGEMIEVSVCALVREILSSLCYIAGLPSDGLEINGCDFTDAIGLDQAIALALYLAITVPPVLDQAVVAKAAVLLTASSRDGLLTLSINADVGVRIELDPLRTKLMNAYLQHLRAESWPNADVGGRLLCFPIDQRRGTALV